MNVVTNRFQACQMCPQRRGNRCQLANQIVSIMARMPTATCPLGRWKEPTFTPKASGTPKPNIAIPQVASPSRTYPETTPRTINRLAAVTCHFNPCGYQRLESNYHRFVQALPADLELWTIELAYGDVPFRLPDGPRMLCVRGDERHVLWQKERLLNLAIESLPKDVDAVAWLDADLIWLNRNWVAEACKLLERYNAVQLFEHVHDTDHEGRLGKIYPGHVYARTQGLGYGRPGGAWAARREVMTGGLYDRHAVGGGDTAAVFAWEGREKLPKTLNHGTVWKSHHDAWAISSYNTVRGSLACVLGDVVHLYHGSRPNRQYVERYNILHDNGYDPVRDVEIDSKTGLLQWSEVARESKPDLVQRVAKYFVERREDE